MSEENLYKCKKCRTILFKETDLDFHEPGVGQEAFTYKKRNKIKDVDCSSFFFKEDLEWMDLSRQEGKIHCLKCNTRLGSWKWFGDQCSCGYWVNPSIQITKSKVDFAPKRQIVNIRSNFTTPKELSDTNLSSDNNNNNNQE
eukprot:TRINITY_DN1383_c3_g3_i1.p1 TRINITY_DN1383_c3_g3~~TRINITY_DN1383_c3_g3_i1.p1  ORF type:complete len:142 (-),score=31.00 TRINITY_DN1383_c3_g3_i1:167-592(-)